MNKQQYFTYLRNLFLLNKKIGLTRLEIIIFILRELGYKFNINDWDKVHETKILIEVYI